VYALVLELAQLAENVHQRLASTALVRKDVEEARHPAAG